MFKNIPPLQEGKLLKKRYYIDIVLGEGTFGRVYKAFDKNNSQTVAIKQILKEPLINNEQYFKLYNQELELLKLFNSENIIKYIDDFNTADSCFLVTEYCNQKSLGDLLYTYKRFSERDVIKHFKQIMNAFKELHRHKVIHRDIKPDNILLSQGQVKLADFGFAKSIEKIIVTSTICGTYTNMAPEIIENKPYGLEVDVYSLGVLLYNLLYGKLPYDSQGNNQSLKKVIKDRISKINYEDPQVQVSNQMKNLLKRMICYDRRQRIRWDEIYQLDILKQNNYASVLVLPGSIVQLPDNKQEAIELYRKYMHLMNTQEENQFQQVDPEIPNNKNNNLNLSVIEEEQTNRSNNDSQEYIRVKEQDKRACIEECQREYEKYRDMMVQLFETFKFNCQIEQTRNRIIQLALSKKLYMMSKRINEALKINKDLFQRNSFKQFLLDPSYETLKNQILPLEEIFLKIYNQSFVETSETLKELIEEGSQNQNLIKLIQEEANLSIYSDNFETLIKMGIIYSHQNIDQELKNFKKKGCNQGEKLSYYFQSYILVEGCLAQDVLFQQQDFNVEKFFQSIQNYSEEKAKQKYFEIIQELDIKQIQL